MIRFTASFIPTDEARKDVSNSRAAQRVIDQVADIKYVSLSNSPTIRLNNPQNIDTDEVYESVEFVITDRFQQEGVTWLAGARFAINLDSLIAAFESVRDRLLAEEQTGQ